MARPARPMEVPQALPPGTRFGDLEIVRTLGVGGFGIVYLARDHALQRMVAIKEYMPGELAHRPGGSQVLVRSRTFTETFDTGRRSFVHEARLLARFDHRSLLKVYQFWEANGTAYMVMPYLSGQTLKQARQAMAKPPDDAWLRRVMLPLLDALTRLHAESVLHRDISPDNIVLPDDGADPILLDFGAARQAISDQTQAITAILKPRYAPIEQYGESSGLKQGPWTDLYALGAVMHYLALGRTPPQATTRAVDDEYEPLVALAPPGLLPGLCAAIDWALRVHPQDRPPSASALRAVLLGEATAPSAVARPLPAGVLPTAPAPPASAEQDTVLVTLPLDQTRTMPVQRVQAARPGSAHAVALPPSWRRSPMAIGAGLGVVVVALVAWAALRALQTPGDEGLPREEMLLDTPAANPALAAPAALPSAPQAEVGAASRAARAKAPSVKASVPAAAARAVANGQASPTQACAEHSIFTRWRCIEQACARPGQSNQPECIQLRNAAGRREGTRNAH
jgi:serine/threonine protein kinase